MASCNHKHLVYKLIKNQGNAGQVLKKASRLKAPLFMAAVIFLFYLRELFYSFGVVGNFISRIVKF